MQYITLEEGADFRRIAQLMTQAGYQMNHATARNVLMTSLIKLFNKLSLNMNTNLSDKQIKDLLRDQKVHEALPDILFQAHQLIEEKEE